MLIFSYIKFKEKNGKTGNYCFFDQKTANFDQKTAILGQF